MHSSTSTVAPITVPSLAEPTPKTPEAAARQFESLLVAQLLRSAREASEDGLDSNGDQNSEKATLHEIAEQQLGQILTRQGGLGLSQMVVQGLKQPASS